ncbi:MAG: hypothetical protein IAF38_23095, partial [Bacteroidia bacterium]|nr:hypothetical protein [Bacteroidia bacterium]
MENFIFIAYGDPQMFVQFYNGKSWSKNKNALGVSHYAGSVYWNMEFDVNDEDTSVIYISTTQLSKSSNGGKTFKTISDYWGPASHADIRDMKILKSTVGGTEDVVGMANDGGVSLSVQGTDDAKGWINANGNGLAITQFWGIGTSEIDPQILMGGGQDNGLYSYVNGNWRAQASGVGDGYDVCISDLNPSYAIGQGNSPGVYLTSNSGENWAGAATVNGPVTSFRRAMQIDKTKHTLWLAHNQLWMKDNANGKLDAKWKQKSFIPHVKSKSGAYLSDVVSCFAVGGKNNSKGMMAYEGPIWANDSLNGKVFYCANLDEEKPVWKDFTRLAPMLDWREITDMIIDENDENKFYTLFESPYDGFDAEVIQVEIFGNGDSVKLTDISYNLPNMPRSKLVMEKNETGNIYMATDSGIYFTNYKLLEEKRWEKFSNSTLPFCNISDLEINYATNRLYVATYGRGVWITPLAETGMNKPVRIKKSVVWDKPKKIDGELIVSAGKTLTISNSVYITSKSKITLKKGAKLIVKQSSRKQLLLDNAGNAFDVSKIVKLKRAVVKIETN